MVNHFLSIFTFLVAVTALIFAALKYYLILIMLSVFFFWAKKESYAQVGIVQSFMSCVAIIFYWLELGSCVSMVLGNLYPLCLHLHNFLLWHDSWYCMRISDDQYFIISILCMIAITRFCYVLIVSCMWVKSLRVIWLLIKTVSSIFDCY